MHLTFRLLFEANPLSFYYLVTWSKLSYAAFHHATLSSAFNRYQIGVIKIPSVYADCDTLTPCNCKAANFIVGPSGGTTGEGFYLSPTPSWGK